MLKNWCFCVVGEDSSRVPWTARSNQSILREINLECSLKGLMLKLKLQYFGHSMRRADSLEKALVLGKIESRRRRGWQRMRWLDGITTLVNMNLGKLQELMRDWEAWLPWGHKESDMTEQLHFHFSLPCIGEGNGNPLQYCCLENPRDGGAWRAAVYGVTQSRRRLKRLSSSSSSSMLHSKVQVNMFPPCYKLF